MDFHPSALDKLVQEDSNYILLLLGRSPFTPKRFAQLNAAFSRYASCAHLVLYSTLAKDPDLQPIERTQQHSLTHCLTLLGDYASAPSPHLLAELTSAITSHLQQDTELVNALLPRVSSNHANSLALRYLQAATSAPSHPHPHFQELPTLTYLLDSHKDRHNADLYTDASGLLSPQSQTIIDKLASLTSAPLHLADNPPTIHDALSALRTDYSLTVPELSAATPLTLDTPVGAITVTVLRPTSTSPADPLPGVVFFSEPNSASPTYLCATSACAVIDIAIVPTSFPHDHDLAIAAYTTLLDLTKELKLSSLALVGEGFGANLALNVAYATKGANSATSLTLLHPLAAISDISSYRENLDATISSFQVSRFFRDYTSDENLNDLRLDLTHIEADDLVGLPPTLIISAGRDPMLDVATTLTINLHKAAVSTTHTIYAFTFAGFFSADPTLLDDAAAAQKEVSLFILSNAALPPLSPPAFPVPTE